MKWLDGIPTAPLLILALTVGLAPFVPLPHLVEKIQLLAAGELVRPVDVFDLVMHASPIVLLLLKIERKLATTAGN